MATDCARVCACVRVVNCMKSSLASNTCSVVRLQYTYWKHLRKEGFPCKPTCTHRPATGNGRGRPRRPGPAARRGCSAEAPWQKCSTRPPATVPDPPLSTLASARRPSPRPPSRVCSRPPAVQFPTRRGGAQREGRGGPAPGQSSPGAGGMLSRHRMSGEGGWGKSCYPSGSRLWGLLPA